MLKVGLTGGIACGKSVVAEMLAARGAHVINADQIGHKLLNPGQAVYEEVVRRFGREILNEDGTISRPQLAAIVFAPGASRIEELNQIVHPAIIAEQDRWAEEMRQRDPQGVVVIDAALILEAGLAGSFDRLIVVTCRPEQKVERLGRRLNIDDITADAEVARRSAAQWPDKDKERAADYVIHNDGTLEETERQVERLYSELKRLAEANV